MSYTEEFHGYDNEVLSNEIESAIITKLGMSKFLTVDNALTEAPGMVRKIHKYKCTNEAVEELARGEGNSTYIEAGYDEVEYRVHREQARAAWFLDDLLTDPTLIDAKIQYVGEAMANNFTKKAIEEFNKTENISVVTDYSLASFADTIAKYADRYESQEGLFFLCNQSLVPELRKMLGDYLKYTEAYIRTGAIGDILGVPVYTSKAVPKGIIFCATKDAVTVFTKQGTFVEQEHDANTKQDTMYATKYDVIALTDETKCIAMGKAQATAATITTASSTTVAGAATTGAKVSAYVNGKAAGVPVTATSSAYSITLADALVSGDEVKVIAELEGKVKSIAEATVA